MTASGVFVKTAMTAALLTLGTLIGLAPPAHTDTEPPPLPPDGPLWYSQLTDAHQTFVNDYVAHGFGMVRVPDDTLHIAALGNHICHLIQDDRETPEQIDATASWGSADKNPITKLAIADICPQYLPQEYW